MAVDWFDIFGLMKRLIVRDNWLAVRLMRHVLVVEGLGDELDLILMNLGVVVMSKRARKTFACC